MLRYEDWVVIKSETAMEKVLGLNFKENPEDFWGFVQREINADNVKEFSHILVTLCPKSYLLAFLNATYVYDSPANHIFYHILNDAIKHKDEAFFTKINPSVFSRIFYSATIAIAKDAAELRAWLNVSIPVSANKKDSIRNIVGIFFNDFLIKLESNQLSPVDLEMLCSVFDEKNMYEIFGLRDEHLRLLLEKIPSSSIVSKIDYMVKKIVNDPSLWNQALKVYASKKSDLASLHPLLDAKLQQHLLTDSLYELKHWSNDEFVDLTVFGAMIYSATKSADGMYKVKEDYNNFIKVFSKRAWRENSVASKDIYEQCLHAIRAIINDVPPASQEAFVEQLKLAFIERVERSNCKSKGILLYNLILLSILYPEARKDLMSILSPYFEKHKVDVWIRLIVAVNHCKRHMRDVIEFCQFFPQAVPSSVQMSKVITRLFEEEKISISNKALDAILASGHEGLIAAFLSIEDLPNWKEIYDEVKGEPIAYSRFVVNLRNLMISKCETKLDLSLFQQYLQKMLEPIHDSFYYDAARQKIKKELLAVGMGGDLVESLILFMRLTKKKFSSHDKDGTLSDPIRSLIGLMAQVGAETLTQFVASQKTRGLIESRLRSLQEFNFNSAASQHMLIGGGFGRGQGEAGSSPASAATPPFQPKK